MRGAGKPPRVVLRVSVEEAFNHCPKAFVRAKLWDATARPSGAPTDGDAASRDGKDAAYAKDYNEQYAERLKTASTEPGTINVRRSQHSRREVDVLPALKEDGASRRSIFAGRKRRDASRRCGRTQA